MDKTTKYLNSSTFDIDGVAWVLSTVDKFTPDQIAKELHLTVEEITEAIQRRSAYEEVLRSG